MSFYLLVASQAQMRSGRLVEAKDVALDRIRTGVWPMFSHTRNRKSITEGDTCLIYISGTGENGRCVIGSVEIAENSEARNFRDEYFYPSLPDRILKLRHPKIFETPVHIGPLIAHMTIRPKNIVRWGCALQGGSRKIAESDFQLVTEGAE